MKQEANTSILRVLNWLGLIVAAVVYLLADALPINGKTTLEVSNAYPNLFSPARFTFGIWGVIYILLALFCLYQVGLFVPRGPKTYLIIKRIGLYFFFASLFNVAWVILWHYQLIAASLIAMILQLVMLLAAYARIDNRTVTAREKWLIRVPFSVYLSWVSVAVIANFAAYLSYARMGGFGINDTVWTVILIVAAAIIAIYVLFKKQDIVFASVFIWAFIGILVRHIATFHSRYGIIMIAAIIAIVILVIGCIRVFAMNLLRKRKTIESAQTQP